MRFERTQFETEFDHAKAALLAFVEHGAAVVKFIVLAWLERKAMPSPVARQIDDGWSKGKLLKITEAAEWASADRRTIDDQIARGHLPVRYVGSDKRVHTDDLEAWSKTQHGRG
jgi:hypothetical protein